MKQTLKPGIVHELRYRVPASKIVAALYPEAAELQLMPRVFATGFLVGLIEWACIQAVNPHLDWPREQSVGTRVNVTHDAATPPGLDVTVRTTLVAVDGRRLVFEFEASDGRDTISRGIHERVVIDASRFEEKVRRKAIEQPSE